MRHAPIALALLALLAGCGHKKTTECNALAAVINDSVIALEKAPRSADDPSGITDLKSMADSMDKVAVSVASVQLTVPELKRVRDDYEKMARGIARAERELAAAAAERNAPKQKAADAALEAAVKQEDPLVDQLNKICQAP